MSDQSESDILELRISVPNIVLRLMRKSFFTGNYLHLLDIFSLKSQCVSV